MRYFIEVSYNGHAYHGWQLQQNAHSVQQELNSALETFFRCPVDTVGSGRTDTGVHAIQQFCHFDLPGEPDLAKAKHKINAILPLDIAIVNIFQVAADAHARFDAISRSYQYHINRNKDPFRHHFSYYYNRELDLVRMNQACQELIGTKDFKSFSKVKTSVEHFRCDITVASWESYNEGYRFYVSANRFLRGMVRSMVGTMLEVGLGRMTVDQFRQVILARDRKEAGRSVPAQGLFLTNIAYPAGTLKEN